MYLHMYVYTHIVNYLIDLLTSSKAKFDNFCGEPITEWAHYTYLHVEKVSTCWRYRISTSSRHPPFL